MTGFLYAVEADTSRFVGRLCDIDEDLSEKDLSKTIAEYQDRIGDDFLVFDSRRRLEFLPEKCGD